MSAGREEGSGKGSQNALLRDIYTSIDAVAMMCGVALFPELLVRPTIGHGRSTLFAKVRKINGLHHLKQSQET
eukprot:gene18150-20670_t